MLDPFAASKRSGRFQVGRPDLPTSHERGDVLGVSGDALRAHRGAEKVTACATACATAVETGVKMPGSWFDARAWGSFWVGLFLAVACFVCFLCCMCLLCVLCLLFVLRCLFGRTRSLLEWEKKCGRLEVKGCV